MTYVNEASVIATSVVFIVLGILAVSLRGFVRRDRKVALGADDWLIVVALILLIASCTVTIAGAAQHTIGSHSAAPNTAAFFHNGTEKSILLRKYLYAFLLLHVPTLGFVKLSILFFYRRIFRGKIFDIVSWTMIGATIVWTIIIEFLFIFRCGTKFTANWGTIKDSQEYCSDQNPRQVGFAVTDVFADLVLLVLPMPIVWRLQMSLRRRLAVSAVLLLGSMAIAASVFRMAFFAETLGTSFLSHPRLFGLPTTDQLGLESLGIFWSLIETGVAVPVACLPTLRPLFHGLSPESVINSIRSMISLPSIHSQQKKEPRGSYDLKSKTGSFEMVPEVPYRHKTGSAEPHRSRDEDPISTHV